MGHSKIQIKSGSRPRRRKFKKPTKKNPGRFEVRDEYDSTGFMSGPGSRYYVYDTRGEYTSNRTFRLKSAAKRHAAQLEKKVATKKNPIPAGKALAFSSKAAARSYAKKNGITGYRILKATKPK